MNLNELAGCKITEHMLFQRMYVQSLTYYGISLVVLITDIKIVGSGLVFRFGICTIFLISFQW